jgi:TrmH family RNA methyltransferase
MIQSRQNRTLKDIRRLRRSKGDAAILEGPHLIEEAIAAAIPLSLVLATPDFLTSSAGRALGISLSEPPLLVEAALLADLADADAPRGVMAVAQLPRSGVEALPRERGALYCYLDGVQDPGNLGALVRVAEAAGARAVALSHHCAHPNHSRALRASAGSLLRLPVAVGVEPTALAERLAGLAAEWVVLVPRGGEDLFTAPFEGTLVLAFGAEGPGVSPDVIERAGRRVTIPIQPPVESLNVTVAAALTLFEIRRRRLAPSPGA